MPELPEVETIKLVLQRKIVGKTIKDIEILSSKSFIGNTEEIRGKKVLNVWRKAKYLGIELDSGQAKMTLLIHLKMTGQLILTGNLQLKTDNKTDNKKGSSKLQVPSFKFIGGHPTEDMMGKMPNFHTRVIFGFSDGSHLYFNDQRRFGWVKIIDNGKWTMENLGPEPLGKDFTWEILKNNLLKHKNMPVKVAIMDQSVISGVGNIYSNEACFNAKLDPRTKVGNLTDIQFKSLHQGVLKALRDGIAHGGSTRAHFVDPEGHKGYFLDYAFVYGLDKHPCKVCKTIIKKIQLGGRGTYYCSKCQK